MKPGQPVLLRTRAEIAAELDSLRRLQTEHRALPVVRSGSFMLRARASLLHGNRTHLHQGRGGTWRGVPNSDQRHRELLHDMTLDLPDLRPAVISRDLHDRLGPYLRFRHFFRNVYGYVLEERRLDELDNGFDEVISAFDRRADRDALDAADVPRARD